MKYLMLLVFTTLVLISCDCEEEFDLVNEEFNLELYTIDDCDETNNNSNRSAESQTEATGILAIKIDGTFDMNLKIPTNLNGSFIEENYSGSLFKSIDEESWIVEDCSSKTGNDEDDCDELNFSITDDMLTWSFVNEEGCTIILKWNKEN